MVDMAEMRRRITDCKRSLSSGVAVLWEPVVVVERNGEGGAGRGAVLGYLAFNGPLPVLWIFPILWTDMLHPGKCPFSKLKLGTDAKEEQDHRGSD